LPNPCYGGDRTVKYNLNNETVYVDKMYQIQASANPWLITKHIFVGDTRIVSKLSYESSDADANYEKDNTYYYHGDHLGSSNFITDKDGAQYEQYLFTPYGETWVEEQSDSLDKINFKFTSKELDEETGLYSFPQRYYEAQVSRWISPDPIYDGVKSGLSIYGYCSNNPLIYHDPSGLATEKKEPLPWEQENPFVKIAQDAAKTAAAKMKEEKIKKYGANSKQVYGHTLISQNDLSFKLGWGYIDGTNYSSLCHATSLMTSQDLNVGIDTDLNIKADFLNQAREITSPTTGLKLINSMGGIGDNLMFVQEYAKFVNAKLNVNTKIPIGIIRGGFLSGEEGKAGSYSVGRSLNGTAGYDIHSVVYDLTHKTVYFNPWTIDGWSHDSKYTSTEISSVQINY
jgi:RHS repeat-associated protein